MVDAVKPGGVVLDLSDGRNATVEVDGKVIYKIDGGPLLGMADAATAAVDALIRSGELVEQAIDDHDVGSITPPARISSSAFADKNDCSRPRLALAARPCPALPDARALPSATASGR